MKRIVLILLALSFALPLLVISSFYAYENWAGQRAWRQVESALKAAGEPLSLDALRPQPVPDAENMAAAPIFRQIFTLQNPQRAAVYELHLPPVERAERTTNLSPLADLARRFQADFSGDSAAASRVILAGLAPMEPMLDAVRKAAERPEAVWPPADGENAAPFLPPLRQTVEVLAARAAVALVENDASTARAELELILRLARDANQPPLLASCVAEQAMIRQALDIARDGLALDRWSNADLLRINTALSRLNLVDSFARSVRGERALFLAAPQLATSKAEALFRFIDFRTPTSEWISTTLCRVAWGLRPAGWLARDQASYASFTQDWLETVLRKGVVRPWALNQWNARLRAMRRSPAELFRTPVTAFALATFTPVARTAAYTQARIDFTRLACAIELQRRATGRIPAALGDLAPAWLDEIPRDSVGGSPYVYRPDENGGYALYGLGWNAQDDGGSAGNVNQFLGPSSSDDWVWQPGAKPLQQAAAD